MYELLWTLLAFFLGAVPFSLLVGRYALHTDIRAVGDGNPGATNVLRSGSRAWAVVALLLDMLKGAAPAALAYVVFGWRGWECFPIALAPLLGHSFSPFLKGQGGKGVAVTAGVWIGLTYGAATAAGTLLLTAAYLVGDNSGWAVAAGFVGVGGYLALFRRDPVLLAIWLVHTALVLWRYRAELRQRPQLRAWLRRE